MKPTDRLVVAIATFSLILAACGTAGGSLGPVPSAAITPSPSAGPSEPDATPAPVVTPAPSDTPSGSPQASPSPAGGDVTIVRAYFFLDGASGTAGLVPILREVAPTKAVAAAALGALFAGPTAAEGAGGISTAIPAGNPLIGISIKNGLATVNLSSDFESGGGSASTITRLGQVVFTLTQFSTVKSVLFQIDGTTVTVFGSAGVVLDGPQARSDYLDLLPAIFVDRPAFGAALGNPGRVTGSAQDIFEATFRVTLLDAAGRTLADEQVMAACMCESGAFETTIHYDVAKAQWGTLRVWDGSAKDGTPENIREYPVWITPAD